MGKGEEWLRKEVEKEGGVLQTVSVSFGVDTCGWWDLMLRSSLENLSFLVQCST